MNQARVRMTPKLIDSLYTEAMLLADEARAYFDRTGREERLRRDPLLRVRLLRRVAEGDHPVMHVIAWAAHARAVEGARSAQRGAIGGAQPWRNPPPATRCACPRLPEGAVAAVRSSQDLFARIQRLQESGRAPRPSPRAQPANAVSSGAF
jgi:regulator of CtrA degradation